MSSRDHDRKILLGIARSKLDYHLHLMSFALTFLCVLVSSLVLSLYYKTDLSTLAASMLFGIAGRIALLMVIDSVLWSFICRAVDHHLDQMYQ